MIVFQKFLLLTIGIFVSVIRLHTIFNDRRFDQFITQEDPLLFHLYFVRIVFDTFWADWVFIFVLYLYFYLYLYLYLYLYSCLADWVLLFSHLDASGQLFAQLSNSHTLPVQHTLLHTTTPTYSPAYLAFDPYFTIVPCLGTRMKNKVKDKGRIKGWKRKRKKRFHPVQQDKR